MWEVFDPSNGNPIYTVRYLWLARLLSRLFHNRHAGGLDYGRIGEGWARTEGIAAIQTAEELAATIGRLQGIMARIDAFSC